MSQLYEEEGTKATTFVWSSLLSFSLQVGLFVRELVLVSGPVSHLASHSGFGN